MIQSMTELPWTIPFLKIVHDEYAKNPPKYNTQSVTKADLEYILSVANQEDPFDKGNLKKEFVIEIQRENTHIIKSICEYGEIILVSFKNSIVEPQWNTWWRAIRLLSPYKKVRILIFGHPSRRLVTPETKNIGPEHLNGGAAMRCDPRSIVIYRSEEITRVLLHELFHASCSDPYSKDTPHIEADTEAWAEILLCGMTARGNPKAWIRFMREQIDWAVKQAETLRNSYKIYTPKDYAWRYIIGRLDVWRSLGIQVPNYKYKNYNILSTLRFTICEPKNV